MVPDQVVAEEAAEQDDGKDLEAEAHKSEVDTELACARRVCRECAAGGLEDEGEDVAGDEDVVEEIRFEARQVRGKVVDPEFVSTTFALLTR